MKDENEPIREKDENTVKHLAGTYEELITIRNKRNTLEV